MALQRYTCCVGMKLDNIACASQFQMMADHTHTAYNQQITAFFGQAIIVAACMIEAAFSSTLIFLPLLFQVNKSPLPATKAEMLDAGHEQIVVRGIHQDILLQVTPTGRDSSTVTA